MSLALRRRDDPKPALEPLAGLGVRRESDPGRLAVLQGRSREEMSARLEAGHRAYVAWLDGAPAAWGWVATRGAAIGELSQVVELPPGERYLWNFVTRPGHRGRGIYPRLLDAIIEAEGCEARLFWIVAAPENRASRAGIARAGFVEVGTLSFDRWGRAALGPRGTRDADAAARTFRLPAVATPLAPCWRCARAVRPAAAGCHDGECRCDYQRPERGC